MRPMRVRPFGKDIKTICSCKYSCLPLKLACCIVYLFICVILYIIIFINIYVHSNIIYVGKYQKEFIYFIGGTILYIYIYSLHLYVTKYKLNYDNLVTFKLYLSQIIYSTNIAHTHLVYDLQFNILFNAQLVIQTKHIHCIPTSNLLYYEIIYSIFYKIINQFIAFIRYNIHIFVENIFAGTTKRIFLNLIFYLCYSLENTLFK